MARTKWESVYDYPLDVLVLCELDGTPRTCTEICWRLNSPYYSRVRRSLLRHEKDGRAVTIKTTQDGAPCCLWLHSVFASDFDAPTKAI